MSLGKVLYFDHFRLQIDISLDFNVDINWADPSLANLHKIPMPLNRIDPFETIYTQKKWIYSYKIPLPWWNWYIWSAVSISVLHSWVTSFPPSSWISCTLHHLSSCSSSQFPDSTLTRSHSHLNKKKNNRLLYIKETAGTTILFNQNQSDKIQKGAASMLPDWFVAALI